VVSLFRITEQLTNGAATVNAEPNLYSGKDSKPMQTSELTEYQEAEESTTITTSRMNQDLLEPYLNPYPDQTPQHILGRSYRIIEYSWTIGTSFAQVLNFPNALCTIPTIAGALETFRWMRSPVQVEIRLNSTPFHYGSLLVSWLPNHSNASHCTGVQQQSANNPMVLSVSKQEAITFTIPWLNPLFYFEPPGSSEVGRVCLTELAPLTAMTANTTDTITITVFAKFLDPQVAGYVVAQSEAVTKTIKGVFDGVKTATSIAKAVFDVAPSITSLIGALAAFDKPLSVASVQPTGHQYTRGMALGDGLDTSQSLSIDPATKVSTEGYIVGNLDTSVPLLGVIGTPMFRKTFTYSSTALSNNYEPIVPVVPGEIQPDYLSFSANMFRYWRGSIKYCLQFYTSPLCSARFRIAVLYEALPTPALINDSGDVVSKVVDVKGDTIVEFTVPFLWNRPYRECYEPGLPEHGLPILAIQSLTPVIAPDNTKDNFIYCCVWRSAGEDFQFIQYTSPKLSITGQSHPVEIFKRPFANILGDGTNNAVEHHYVSPERIQTCNELWHRFSTSVGTTSIPGPNTNNVAESFPYWSKVFKHWRGSRRMKFFFDADIGMEYYPNLVTLARNRSVIASVAAGDAMAATMPTYPWLEVEIPYYSTVAFKLVTNNGAGFNEPVTDFLINTGSENVAPLLLQFWAGGDDFTYGYLYAPPTYDTAPTV